MQQKFLIIGGEASGKTRLGRFIETGKKALKLRGCDATLIQDCITEGTLNASIQVLIWDGITKDELPSALKQCALVKADIVLICQIKKLEAETDHFNALGFIVVELPNNPLYLTNC